MGPVDTVRVVDAVHVLEHMWFFFIKRMIKKRMLLKMSIVSIHFQCQTLTAESLNL